MNPNDDDRLSDVDEILADIALFGIESTERAETPIDRAGSGAADEFESLAALVMVAGIAPAEPLPTGWMDRLSDRFDAECGAEPTARTAAAAVPSTQSSVVPFQTGQRSNGSMRLLMTFVGAIAAAFVIGVAIGRWTGVEPASVAVVAESLADRYRELSQLADTTRVDWKPNADGEISGFVVWNDRLQTGFMAFDSLPVNDPRIEQYQLWIFDAARDDERPVDGGVFDFAFDRLVQVDGRTLVPVDAKLPIERAKMFALTIEAPGGVVVSGRERLPGLAVVP